MTGFYKQNALPTGFHYANLKSEMIRCCVIISLILDHSKLTITGHSNVFTVGGEKTWQTKQN